MASPRLTPKQKGYLTAIANHWGHAFHIYVGYGFLVEKSLVRPATKDEIEQHYADAKEAFRRLDAKAKIFTAVSAGNWDEVERLAKTAKWAEQELKDRVSEQDSLVVLTDEALEIVAHRELVN